MTEWEGGNELVAGAWCNGEGEAVSEQVVSVYACVNMSELTRKKGAPKMSE